MLSRQNRLRQRFDFIKVKRHGQSVSRRFFYVSYLKNERERTPRFGFVVSRRLDKRATVRNRAKRLLREAVRLWLKENQVWLGRFPLGFTIVFTARKEILKADYGQIYRLVGEILSTALKPRG